MVPNVVFKSFAPHGGILGFEFPPDYGSPESGVYGETLFQVLLSAWMWFSSHLSNVQSSLKKLSFFFRGKLFICSCRVSAPVGQGEFRIFLHHHHVPFSSVIFIINTHFRDEELTQRGKSGKNLVIQLILQMGNIVNQ